MNSTLTSASAFPPQVVGPAAVNAWRQDALSSMIENGPYKEYTLMTLLFSYGPLLTFLMVPQMNGLFIRAGAFILNLAVQVHIIRHYRTANTYLGLGIGFFSGWHILWSIHLLVVNSAKRTFKKVHRRTSADGKHSYEWQPYPRKPDDWLARFWWSVDLLFNSRGMAWSWKVSDTPSRPPVVERDLQEQKISLVEAEKADVPRTKTGRHRPTSRLMAIVYFSSQLITSLLLLDACQQITRRDPYFSGFVDDAPPPIFLPSFVTTSNYLTSAYRSNVGLVFMVLMVKMICAPVPLFYLLLPFGGGVNSEAWLWPDQFGSYSNLAARGLAGYWGGWWHQWFRQAFQSCAQWLIGAIFRLRPGKGSNIEVITVFTVSGLLHVAASSTTIGPTRPWRDMFMFFAFQAAGIILEREIAQAIRKVVRIPKWIGFVGHLVYWQLCIIATFPLLTRDLARAGFYLYEPLPFSPSQFLLEVDIWGKQRFL